MNSRFLFLLVVIVISILVFTWGTTNYLRCYTDTPDDNYTQLCPTNIDVYAMPAVIATFVMMGIVTIITWMKTRHHKFWVVFVALSGVGIFFVFVGILNLILMVRT